MACINDARCDDLGMCFIRAQSGGDQMGVRLDESTLGETAVGTLALTLLLLLLLLLLCDCLLLCGFNMVIKGLIFNFVSLISSFPMHVCGFQTKFALQMQSYTNGCLYTNVG